MDFFFGSKSKTRSNNTIQKGEMVYHHNKHCKGHHLNKSIHCSHAGPCKGHHLSKSIPCSHSFHKGSKSKTHKNRLDFTTKKGDKVFHRKGHYVRKSRKPYK